MAIVELTPNETVLRIVYKHVYAFLGDLFAIGALTLIPILFAIVVLFVLPQDVANSVFSGNPTIGVLFISGTALLFIWMYAWWRWTNYFLNVVVITNERIYEIKQRGFFGRVVGSFGLERIQNITTTQSGIFSTAFNFGNLHIETAGENENLNMTTVPNPTELKQFINELEDHFKTNSNE